MKDENRRFLLEKKKKCERYKQYSEGLLNVREKRSTEATFRSGKILCALKKLMRAASAATGASVELNPFYHTFVFLLQLVS